MKNATIILLFLLFIPLSCILGQKRKMNDSSFNEVNCKTEEKTNPDSKIDPIIIKTCVWNNYKFVITGEPDYRGRYGYEYELFFIDNGQQKKIANSDMFNNQKNKLEELINQVIKNDFDNYKSDPGTSDCMEGVEFVKFKLDDMGISFTENNEIEFNVSFGLGGACYNVDGTSVSFKMSDIQEYLKK